jgi:hypothetical protein
MEKLSLKEKKMIMLKYLMMVQDLKMVQRVLSQVMYKNNLRILGSR